MKYTAIVGNERVKLSLSAVLLDCRSIYNVMTRQVNRVGDYGYDQVGDVNWCIIQTDKEITDGGIWRLISFALCSCGGYIKCIFKVMYNKYWGTHSIDNPLNFYQVACI